MSASAVHSLWTTAATAADPISKIPAPKIEYGQLSPTLIVLLIFLGVYPKPVTDIVDPAVKQTLSDVHKKDPRPEVEAAK